MKQSILIGTILTALLLDVSGRTWTDQQGRKIDAEVVRLGDDRTVTLRTDRGRTVTVPFSTFVPADIEHLEYLLSRKGRGKLHPVPWNELNELFGIAIWQDDHLWDDATAQTAERMQLKEESKTDFMENHRSYPLGKAKVLTEPVYTIALYGGETHAESISFVFLNQGDFPINGGSTTTRKIKESGLRLQVTLEQMLGEPRRDTLGKEDLCEKVWRWDWNGHAIMLSVQESKYAALRIMPTDRADRAGRVEKITEAGLKARMASCVVRHENGDVIIRNIPMVNQGPKGYCSPATWERYLRYMNIPADMYLLALAGNTGVGGGTYMHDMMNATQSLISANGRELVPISSSLAPESMAEYIDQGLPIMWRIGSTPAFQHAVNANTARRNGQEVEPKPSGQAEDSQANGHICLIIGYNKQTGEIAISDSWGPLFAERWVDHREAERVTTGGYDAMNVIKW